MEAEKRNGGSLEIRLGAWVLAAIGIAQIVLAAVFRSAVAVAPVFAFLGTACVVLAVVLERAEGNLELTVSGLRVFLADLARRPEIVQASGETVVDALDAELGRGSWGRTRLPKELAERVAGELIAARDSEAEAVERAKASLKNDGWEVQEFGQFRQGFPYDLIVDRDGETLYVEVKASPRPLSEAVVQRAIAVRDLIPTITSGNATYALWAATPGVSGAALKLAKESNIALFVEQQPRTVSRFN